jgi:hypothetical protein
MLRARSEVSMSMRRLPLLLLPLLAACDRTDKSDDPPVDADGDGFFSDEDCDDADPAVNPDAQEVCNGVDDDCDGDVDIEDPDVQGTSSWPVDSDGDGYGDPSLSADGCSQPEGTADNTDDCDDRDSSVNPGADELCDGVDNDCDGDVDAEDSDPVGVSFWAPDADGDGFGDADQGVYACESPEDGWINNANDCDDADAAVYPEAPETCGDGADADCDGYDGPPAFDGSGTLACAQVWWDGESGVSGLGAAVAGAGDVDGDGLPDVVATSEGAAWLFTGIVGGGGDTSDAHVEVTPLGSGAAVAGGDLDGDAFADLVVGDPVAGEVALLAGAAAGGTVDPGAGGALSLLGTLALPGAGGAVAVVDDHDGSGAAAVAVGGPESGAAWVFIGPFSGTLGEAQASAEVATTGDRVAVAGIGDADGDGKGDLVVGDPGAGGGDGRVLFVRDLSVEARLTGADGEGAGWSVSPAGDWDGDGTLDVAIGAPGSDAEAAGAGAVWIVSGDVSGDAAIADVAIAVLTGREAGQAAGTSVATAGDVNGDGFVDLLVGAPGTDGGRGAALVVLGPVEDEASLGDVAYSEQGEAAADAAGTAVGGAGDVDGDGIDDVLVGAPGAVAGAGAAYLYFGGGL